MLFSEEAAAIYSNTSLTIFKADLDPDSVYFYQMQYGDRFSNVLQIITAPNGSISYLLGGDRGVADRGDQLLPGLGQPAPEVPEEDATGNTSVPQNEPLYEWLTESTTTLSGSRLRALLAANPHSVLFEKKGIAIELQSSELEALNFSDSSLFSVTIEQPDANSFRFSTLLDHKALTALSAMVSLPYLPADGEDAGRLACYDVNGTQIGKATYDPALGIITFSVPSSGTYFISTQKADAVTPSDLPPTNPANGAAGSILSNDKAGASVIMWVTMVAAAMFAVFLLIAGLCRRLGGRHHD